MSLRVIGIDPGASGAMAFATENGVVVHKTKSVEPYDALVDARPYVHNPAGRPEYHAVAYVEEVGGFIGKPQPGSAMFKFGRQYGYWLGLLRAMGVRTILVKPQAWQKGLSGLQGKKGAERKRALRDEAARRFPGVKVTLDNCDALLIADYGRRMERSVGEALSEGRVV